MKPAGEIATKASKAITQGFVRPCKDKPPHEDRLIGRLFAVMTIKYSQKWTSNFPDEVMLNAAKREWGKELGIYSSDHIAWAVDNCVDEFPDWPPTIGQFKNLCKMAQIEPAYKPPAIDNPTKKETAIKHLAAIRELLK